MFIIINNVLAFGHDAKRHHVPKRSAKLRQIYLNTKLYGKKIT